MSFARRTPPSPRLAIDPSSLADSFADLSTKAFGALEMAKPLVQEKLDVALPAVKQGVDAAIPVVKQGVEIAAPTVVGVANSAVRAAGTVAVETGKAITSTLPVEQQEQLANAAKVGGQVTEVVGGVTSAGVKVALPVVKQGAKIAVEQGVPLAGEAARTVGKTVELGVKEAAPVVDELLRNNGQLSGETVEKVRGGTLGALKLGVRTAAEGMRSVANEIAPPIVASGDDAAAAARGAASSAASRGRGGGALLALPSAKEVTDDLAESFVQAAAPYAFGALLLSYAFSALLELAKPLAEAVRNALALAFLLACANLAYLNWDAIYGLYQVASGEVPLKIL